MLAPNNVTTVWPCAPMPTKTNPATRNTIATNEANSVANFSVGSPALVSCPIAYFLPHLTTGCDSIPLFPEMKQLSFRKAAPALRKCEHGYRHSPRDARSNARKDILWSRHARQQPVLRSGAGFLSSPSPWNRWRNADFAAGWLGRPAGIAAGQPAWHAAGRWRCGPHGWLCVGALIRVLPQPGL